MNNILPDSPASLDAPPDSARLFVGFSKIALNGFGGVLPFAYRGLVEQHRWLTASEFAELFAASQVLPGPTICNMSVMVGWRFAGLRGALAALAGMLTGPLIVIIFLGMLYQRYQELTLVRAALSGMSAVATGLIAATAIKLALPIWRLSSGRSSAIVLALLAFGGLGLLRLPLIAVIAVLAPLGIALVWRNTP